MIVNLTRNIVAKVARRCLYSNLNLSCAYTPHSTRFLLPESSVEKGGVYFGQLTDYKYIFTYADYLYGYRAVVYSELDFCGMDLKHSLLVAVVRQLQNINIHNTLSLTGWWLQTLELPYTQVNKRN